MAQKSKNYNFQICSLLFRHWNPPYQMEPSWNLKKVFQIHVPKLPIFYTVKRTIHFTLFKISLKVKIEIKWDQRPLKTEINMFVLNTKPFLTNTWERRYIHNDYDKNAFLLEFCIKNLIKHTDTINDLLNISASKNLSEMVLYSKRT